MTNTINNILSNNFFLPYHEEQDDVNHFRNTDSKRCFEKNLKTQPDDWYYRHNPVTYTVNSKGYRAPEFSTVDWEAAVVIFGCSNVFGVGVSDEHTISSQLSKLINRPVINLGVTGSSIQYATFNSAILTAYPCPYAVIQLWTSVERTVVFTRTMIHCLGPWSYKPKSLYNKWLENNNPRATALLHRTISQELWKNRSQYLEATLFLDTADQFDHCKLFKYYDHARDQIHPGKLTAARIAAHFAEQLT